MGRTSTSGSRPRPTTIRSETPRWLDLLAADDVVLSSHPEPIEFLPHLDEWIEWDATVGAIDAAAFVRTVLDAAVTTYFEAVDAIEDAVDALDGRALSRAPDEDVLRDLVTLRRRIARLRRALSDQREVFAAFARRTSRSPRRPTTRSVPGGRGPVRERPRVRRGQPRPAARLVRRVHDPDGAAHERDHEGPRPGDRPAAAGIAHRRAARDERAVPLPKDDPANLHDVFGHEPHLELITAKDIAHQQVAGPGVPVLLGPLDGLADPQDRRLVRFEEAIDHNADRFRAVRSSGDGCQLGRVARVADGDPSEALDALGGSGSTSSFCWAACLSNRRWSW